MVRVVVDHPDKKALEIFAREIAPAGTSWSPGTTMPAGGRPSPSPLIKPFAFLLDKQRVPVTVRIGDQVIAIDTAGTGTGADSPGRRHCCSHRLRGQTQSAAPWSTCR